MKAIRVHKFGGPDVLQLDEVPDPTPGPGQLVVRVRAAGVNPVDARGRATFIERFIHGEIYKARADVRAVVHCHSPAIIPFGVTGVPLRPLYHMSAFIWEGVPLFDIRDGRAA